MKKRLIPVLLILAVFAGCTGGSNNNGPASPPQAGAATAVIMPAMENPGPPPTAGPITLTSNSATPNKMVIAAVFVGPSLNQTVTVTSNGVSLATFSNAPGGNLYPQVLPEPKMGVYDTITGQWGTPPQPYTNVVNIPNLPNVSNIVSTYSDGAGDTVRVFVTDLGIAAP